MGIVVRFHARISTRPSASFCRSASASNVIWPQAFSPAIRTIWNQRPGGINLRCRQVLTVDNGKPRAAATAPVPPKSSIAESTVTDMGDTIVRDLRTCQEFATCETTFSPGSGEIGSIMEPYDSDKIRAVLTRQLLDCDTQADFLSKTGIAKSSWSEIEKGKRTITLAMARTIKKRCNLSLDWTLDGDPTALSIKHQRKLRTLKPLAA